MKLTPWKARGTDVDIFEDLEDIQREMNQIFDFRLHHPWKKGNGGPFLPAVDVIDEKDNIVVKAELPGMKKDEIEVSIDDNILTIKGEKKEEKETKEKDYVRSERYYGSFNRSFTLPSSVDAQKVDASYKDGVLEIILTKREEAKQNQKRINIK